MLLLALVVVVVPSLLLLLCCCWRQSCCCARGGGIEGEALESEKTHSFVMGSLYCLPTSAPACHASFLASWVTACLPGWLAGLVLWIGCKLRTTRKFICDIIVHHNSLSSSRKLCSSLAFLADVVVAIALLLVLLLLLSFSSSSAPR